MSYCNDLCEQRDASVEWTFGIDSVLHWELWLYLWVCFWIVGSRWIMLNNTDVGGAVYEEVLGSFFAPYFEE